MICYTLRTYLSYPHISSYDLIFVVLKIKLKIYLLSQTLQEIAYRT